MSGKHYPSVFDYLTMTMTSAEAKRMRALESALSNIDSDGDCLLVVVDFVKRQKVCSRFI